MEKYELAALSAYIMSMKIYIINDCIILMRIGSPAANTFLLAYLRNMPRDERAESYLTSTRHLTEEGRNMKQRERQL